MKLYCRKSPIGSPSIRPGYEQYAGPALLSHPEMSKPEGMSSVASFDRTLTTPRRLGPGPSAQLDLIRAVVAWAVMWSHLRSLFFEDMPLVHNKGAAVKVFYLLTGFGHQSVIVFFVLSGFLVSSATFEQDCVRKIFAT